jgi:hypothetical protein
MTTNVIHDMAEQWLPIPLPEYKDCPPTFQETLRDPRVLMAQRILQMQMANHQAAQAKQQQRSAVHHPMSRRKRR